MKRFVSFIFAFALAASVFAERPIVKDIQAVAGKGGKINVYWTLPENPEPAIKSLLLYRDTKPLSSWQQLEQLEPLAELSADVSGYTDTVSDFTDYFYAIIAVTPEPDTRVLLSVNSTVYGVHLEIQKNSQVEKQKNYEKLYPDGTSREMPLPYIDFVDGLNPVESTLSQDVVDTAKALARPTSTAKVKLQPYYFEEDLISPDNGDEYLLFDILKNYFVQKNYEQSEIELEKLIGTNISEGTRVRANFYLGEAHYFMAEYDEAIKIFCRTESTYENLSKCWLDSALDLLN